jgi:hypothetical protein
MDIQRLLNTPPRRRLPSEILETPPPPPLIPLSQLSTQSWDSQNSPRPLLQLSTQSWDSQNGPRPPCELSFTSQSSQISLPQTPQKKYAPHTTRSDRIRIKTALDFNIPPHEIQKKYGFTARQIQLAKQ